MPGDQRTNPNLPDHDVKPDKTVHLPAKPRRPGTPLGRVDRYALLQKLGAGNFGAVFHARDEVADVEVALKALPPVLADNSEELEKVRDNFKLIAKLRHPNIGSLLLLHAVESVDAVAREVFGVSHGDQLIVMDYIAGVTLATWRRQFPDGIVPLPEVLALAEQIASALDYAHSQHIIHRDIKPANLLVTTAGKVSVLDFGLAAQIHLSMSRVSQGTADRSGTPAYMAPEQWLGMTQGPGADQYSLAAVVYELLSGAVPFVTAFQTNSAIIMYNTVRKRDPEPLPALNRHENAALLRALAKRPEYRFASCSDFIKALSGKGAVRGRRPPHRAPAPALGRGRLRKLPVLLGMLVAAAAGYWTADQVGARFGTDASLRRLRFEQQRKRIDARLAEARTALQAGNHEKAAAAVTAVLQLDPGNRAGDALRREVEAAVGLSTVVPVRSAVEMKWQRTRELDRGQGFGAALDRCQAVLGAAQALEEAAAYDLALQKYGQLREECERLLQLDGLRREALRDRETAATARNRAVAADAGAAAPGIMAGADELAESAAAAFAAGRFDEAATPWVTAVAEYAKAEAAAKGRRAVQIAKTAYEAELQQADAALLDTFGGPLWAELREAVEEAETLTAEGNWDAALQKFEQAHAALPAVLAAALRAKTHPVAITSADAAASARVAAAVARAEAARVEADWDTVIRCATEALGHDPGAARAQALLNEARKARACRITVSAAVGETEIRGARISVDGVLQDERTPATIELQRGREYTIRVLPEAAPGQRRFAPFETVYRVDVGGDRELRARLEEMRFYPDLIAVADAAAAPLNGLAAGSEEALARQRETAHGLGVPVEVRTQKAGIALCLVPPGRFTMGPTASNAGAKATMPGSRVVTLTKPVYVGKIEVTRAQWDMVMGIVQKGRTPVRPALPAVQVNWIECERFCRALCRLEGVPEGTYRLLTEAEWEYACRAGTDTAYYTGETVADLSRAGWHAANSDSRLHPGAQRQANAWGLYDLPGNAREWCLDWYGAYPAQVVTDPPGPADGTHRVVRGGSWSDAPDACAASYRQHYPPEFREEYLGFRVARETW